MNENFNSLDERLKAADPAASHTELPGEDLLYRAAERAEEGKKSGRRKPRLTWQFQTQLQRVAVAGVAAVAVTAFALPSIVGGSNPRPLITVGGSAPQGSGVGAEAGASQIGGAQTANLKISDAKMSVMMPWVQYEYHYTDAGLSTATGRDNIYQLVPKLGVSDIADALRTALGVKGKLQLGGTDEWPYYFIGALDPYNTKTEAENLEVWKHPVVTINPVGGSNTIPYFSYSDSSAQPGYDCPTVDGALYVQGDSTGSDMAPVPTEPGTTDPCKLILPSDAAPVDKSAAKASSITLFKALGYSVGNGVKNTAEDYLWLQTTEDDWNYNVTGWLVVDGKVVTQSISASWSVHTGKLSSVSGMVGKAKNMGAYDLLSPQQAMNRLDQNRWGGDFWADWNNFKWSDELNQGFVAIDDSMARDAIGTESSSSDPAPEPTPSIKVVSLKLTRSTQTLMGVWDADQRLWLVPGYLYFDATGYVGNAFAVQDGVLQLPDYSQIQPMTK